MFYVKCLQRRVESKTMKRILCIFIATLVVGNLLWIHALASEQGSLDISQEYIVENMQLWTGESLAINISEADSVSVDITRRLQYEDDDMLIFAFYTDAGELINIYSDFVNIDFGVKTNVKIPVQITDNKILGEVRTFIWSNFNDLVPVSNKLSSKNHSDTRFEVVPSPDDEENTDEGDDVYELPSISEGEVPPIVPGDTDYPSPEIPGIDDVIEFNHYTPSADGFIDFMKSQCGF